MCGVGVEDEYHIFSNAKWFERAGMLLD